MSESLYICAASLCCCLVVCSLVRLVAPAGNTTKILSLVIGVFALCCLVSPFATLVNEVEFDSFQYEYEETQTELSLKYNEEILKTTGDYINSYVKVLLTSAEIMPEDIRTTLGVSNENGIYIKEMNIYINKNSSYKSETIEDLIETSVGIKPKVRVK